jgi:hypothetical protein
MKAVGRLAMNLKAARDGARAAAASETHARRFDSSGRREHYYAENTIMLTPSSEPARRLQPKLDTLRELFLKSGNLCAYPGCNKLMMNSAGVFVGQICHIEAAEASGPRFNPSMSNEERRSFANLMIMCYDHHQITNNTRTYPVERLKQYKADHERLFSRPDRAIINTLTDWTTSVAPTTPQNLRRLLRIETGEQLTESTQAMLSESVEEMTDYIDRFRRAPLAVRRFVGSIAERINRMKDSPAVGTGTQSARILVQDLAGAFNISKTAIMELAKQLEHYNLGSVDELFIGDDSYPAVRIAGLPSGWDIWLSIAIFCEREHEPFSVFTEDLDFSRLDD